MKKTTFWVAALLLCGTATHAWADIMPSMSTNNQKSLQIQNAWAQATPKGADSGAAYVTIVNHGNSDDKLVSVATDVADEAMVHTTDMSGGTMHMAAMDGGLIIPARQSITLKPGDKHIMLMGLHHPINTGDQVHLTLQFAKAGTVPVTATAKPIGHE
jgi:copper(I)-binding protein